MLCRDVMFPLVFKCTEDTPVVECAQRMRDEQIGFLPVVDAKGMAVGVVTDRDLAVRVLAERQSPSTPVRAVMTPGPLLICLPDEPLGTVERRMAQAKKSRVLVVDHIGTVLGVISLSDISVAEGNVERTGSLLRDLAIREPAARRP
jgi:CBS domain-containing protein